MTENTETKKEVTLSPSRAQPMAAAKSHSMEINLLGQKIVLKSSETNPELLDQVLQLVNSQLKDAELIAKSAPPHQVVLLALLNLAEEYVKAKNRTLRFKQEVDLKSSQLISLVEPSSR